MKQLLRVPRKAYRFALGLAVAMHLQKPASDRRRAERAIRFGSHAALFLTILGIGAVVFVWPEHSRAACVAAVMMVVCIRINRNFLRAARVMGRWQDRHHVA